MRTNNSGLKRKTEGPKRSRWDKYLLAGALALAATGIIKHGFGSCDSNRTRPPVVNTSHPSSRTISRQSNRIARKRFISWVRSMREKLALSSAPDPLNGMIEHDLPYDSLHCKISPGNDSDPSQEASGATKFSELLRSFKKDAWLRSVDVDKWTEDAEWLYRISCQDGSECAPKLPRELKHIISSSASDTEKELIHFVNSLNAINIQWPENSDPSDIYLAHIRNLRGVLEGTPLNSDQRCVARLAYASRLVLTAQAFLAEWVVHFSDEVGNVIPKLSDDAKAGFIQALSTTTPFSYYHGSADTVRDVFSQIPDGLKHIFLEMFEKRKPSPIRLADYVLEDLSSHGDDRLREAAGRLLAYREAQKEASNSHLNLPKHNSYDD